MKLAHALAPFFRRPDPRSVREVEDEIAEELAFHVAMEARELALAGWEPSAAGAEAERRFGDRARIAHACKAVQLGDRIMLQRTLVVAVLVLLVSVAGLVLHACTAQRSAQEEIDALRTQMAALEQRAYGAVGVPTLATVFADARSGAQDPLGRPAGEDGRTDAAPERDAAWWLDRFSRAEGWRAGLAVGEELALLPPAEALAVLREIYAAIPAVEVRQQLLKAFVFDGGHPETVRILHLAATDTEPAVQSWAFSYPRSYAFQDFGRDYASYRAWYQRFGELPVQEVLRTNTLEYVARLRELTGRQLVDALALGARLDARTGAKTGAALPEHFARAGAWDALGARVREVDPEVALAALRVAERLGPDEVFLHEHVIPALEGRTSAGARELDAEVLAALCDLDARSGRFEAVEELTRFALSRIARAGAAPGGADAALDAALRGLARTQRAQALPQLIGLLAASDTPALRERFAGPLAELTGVQTAEPRDAAWWLDWWEKNQERLPAEVRGSSIPKFLISRF